VVHTSLHIAPAAARLDAVGGARCFESVNDLAHEGCLLRENWVSRDSDHEEY
jgi:hypothetical protein